MSPERQVPIPTSQRLTDLAPHTLWLTRLGAQLAQLSDEGADIINLGMGNPDRPTSPRVVKAGQQAMADPATHSYPRHRGLPAFNQALAEHYDATFGVALDPTSQIMPTTGSQEALFNLNLGFTNPGDVVLSGDPGYPIHFSGPILAGARSVYVPLREDSGYAPDFDAVDENTAAATTLMYLCYPNNPTGAPVPEGVFTEAVAFARKYDIIVVNDFAYGELGLDGYRPPSFLNTPGAMDVGVELFSMTKAYNMAGWRLGAVLGRSDVIDRYWEIKTEVDCGTFHAVQAAGAAALAPEGAADVEAMRQLYARRRDLVCDALEAGGVRVERQVATPYVWSPIPAGYESCEAFAQHVLATTHVAISPGWAFGPTGVNHFRISLMAPDDRLALAAERLARLGDAP